jgi:hypothetical protein
MRRANEVGAVAMLLLDGAAKLDEPPRRSSQHATTFASMCRSNNAPDDTPGDTRATRRATRGRHAVRPAKLRQALARRLHPA